MVFIFLRLCEGGEFNFSCFPVNTAVKCINFFLNFMESKKTFKVQDKRGLGKG